MHDGKTTIERALELAATGQYAKMSDIRHVLKREGYPGVEPNLAGDGIRRQLKLIIQAAQRPTAPPQADLPTKDLNRSG